jgi:cysteine desulfurase
LNSCQELEQQGYKVDYLPVNADGLIDLEYLKSLITADTALVTIMYVNNEIGTIQPVSEIAAICRQLQVPFHTDACQAAGYLDLDFSDFDAVTLNSSKIYGPKGAGLLYIKSGIPFQPLFSGGDQEFGFRPGTENVPAIIGFSRALQIAIQRQPTEQARILKLRNQLLDLLLTIPDTKLNGSRHHRIANNINLSFEGIEGESAVIRLDQIGLICATGSACSSKNVDPSHVLLAINPSRDNAHSSLRLTLGHYITEKDIPLAYNAIKNTVQDLRAFANM